MAKSYLTKTCPQCGEEFTGLAHRIRSRTFCSHACALASRNRRITIKCATCGVEFQVRRYRKETARFCSTACQWEGLKYKTSLEERFWACVSVGRPDECWPWSGLISTAGYGVIRKDSHSNYSRAHILAYVFAYGPIPAGLIVRHKCHNRPCCNSNHLMVGTQTDNVNDMTSANRQAKGERVAGAKLTAEIVLFIRSPTRNESRTALAQRLGVHPDTIKLAETYETWKHIR